MLKGIHYTMTIDGIPQQYAWGCDNNFTIEEYEELITCIHDKIKKEYRDDETCRFYSMLLGKLLLAANQE